MENGSYLGSYDYSKNEEQTVLVIGQKNFVTHEVDFVNAFPGKEASDLLKQLLVDPKIGHSTFIISWDYTRGIEKTIALVGTKQPSDQDIQVLNTLKGKDAFELVKQLSGKNNI